MLSLVPIIQTAAKHNAPTALDRSFSVGFPSAGHTSIHWNILGRTASAGSASSATQITVFPSARIVCSSSGSPPWRQGRKVARFVFARQPQSSILHAPLRHRMLPMAPL